MTKFILHGGFTRKDNDSNKSFFRELIKDIPNGGSLMLVFFASREDDTSGKFEELKNKIVEQAGERDLNFIFATKENFVEQVKKADGIYIGGGSTNKLLGILRSYPEFKSLLENKTVAGSSAGAYAIATLGASHSEDAMRTGLGLAPLRVVCHYESPELPPAKGAVELLNQSRLDLELVLLRDCEWKVYYFNNHL